MKFSFRQMLASAAGAVAAASIASFFGVKGTIIGVAIGSAAATMGTAITARSIDRTHHAVRQVVVRAPETSLLRRLGGTDATGAVTESVAPVETPVTEEVSSNQAQLDQTATTDISRPEPATALTPAVVAPALAAATATAGAGTDHVGKPSRKFSWPVLVGTIVGVFVFSLLVVTAVELIAGRPLADLFGGHPNGGSTTVQNVFGGSTKHATTTTTTTVPAPTTTTTMAGTTTTTSGTSTTTTTTQPTTTTTGLTTTTTSTTTTVPSP